MKLNTGFGQCFIAAILLLTFVLYQCKTGSKREIVNIAGAYKLMPNGGGSVETGSNSVDINKIKIFTQDYYMQAQKNKLDSITSFEIGTYTLDGGILKQNAIFSSYGSTSYEPTTDSFDLKIMGVEDIQLTMKSNSNNKESQSNLEYYKRAGNKSQSVIDGVWHQIKTFSVLGKDTTWDKGTNYKILYDGFVIWGDFHMDPVTQKHNTFMGFGTFVMKGKTKLEETYIKSNYGPNEGKTFYIDVEFKDDDEFAQSILNEETGIRYVEVYRRLDIR